MISVNSEAQLLRLGRRLRDARLRRNEPQREFAVRLGVSIPTLRKMETGDPSVSIGVWVEALDLLDRLSDIEQLLAIEPSLLEQYDQSKKKPRQRASRKRAP
jgi:transcriptional regulator with XRE-family HTH domain